MMTRWVTRRYLALVLSMAASWAGAGVLEHRLVTLAPHITELVFAAGAGHTIVATVNSSDYPPAAATLPRIGDGINLDPERLLATGATELIAWQANAAYSAVAEKLQAFGLRLSYIEPKTLSAIPDAILDLGTRLGTAHEALTHADELRADLAALRSRYAGKPSVTLFIEVGSHPLYTLGNDPLINDALSYCGARNLFAGVPTPAPQVSPEHLVALQPEIIIVGTTDPARLEEAQRRWATLGISAARRGHLFGIDPDALFRPGPRLIAATQALCRRVDSVRDANKALAD